MTRKKRKILRKGPDRMNKKNERLSLVSRYAEKGSGLDIGCGLMKCHENAVGYDKDAGVGADIVGNAEDLSRFNDGQFDFIISVHCLEHLADTKRVLREWDRTLKKGGTMAIIVPDEEFKEHTILEDGHRVAFRKNTMRKLIKYYLGYKVTECRNPVELKDKKNRGDILCVGIKRTKKHD